MICPKCQKDVTPLVLEQCRILTCPNKEPTNTSGKVNQLFKVDGNGFEVDGALYLSGDGIP